MGPVFGLQKPEMRLSLMTPGRSTSEYSTEGSPPSRDFVKSFQDDAS